MRLWQRRQASHHAAHTALQIPLPCGKSALFVYLQGWVISNNHSSQDRVLCLPLSSRSSLALKDDLNVIHTPSRQSATDKTHKTPLYLNLFYLRDDILGYCAFQHAWGNRAQGEHGTNQEGCLIPLTLRRHNFWGINWSADAEFRDDVTYWQLYFAPKTCFSS